MGEVYKARDSRLDRTVAIKVSQEKFSGHFEREARAVAALNHPNICTLHDVGPNYLVMEYVEGTPIRGPMPLDKAIDYGCQILNALDAAHRKGITHRDLKPDNILLSKQNIKLLDFGLAKQAMPLQESDATRALTLKGSIVGTLQYMAPEQLQGKEADARSDIFSFGCVLYELLTGARAFEGANAASVITAVMSREPEPLASMQVAAPAAMERVLRRCLAKDPDERWQSVRDLRDELEWIAETGGVAALPSARPRGAWSSLAGWIAAAVIAIAFLWFAHSHWNDQPEGGGVRLAINPPEKTIFSFGFQGITVPVPLLAVSPDGRAIAFAATSTEGRTRLWLRLLEDTTAHPLPGTEECTDPFWSPDSRWLGFVSEGKLKKIPAGGGPVQVIAAHGNSRGASWGPDGTILFASGNTGLFRVASSGGPVTEVTRLDVSRQEGSHRFPRFLPDGRHFLYLIRSGLAEQCGIYAGSLDGKSKKMLLRVDSNAVYAPPGYLLYLDGDMLLAHAFDPGRIELSGQPLTIAERVGHASVGYASMSVSSNGVLVYAGPILRSGRLTWLDREGKSLGTLAPEGDYTDFRLSPDENRLAASLINPRAGSVDIWLTDIARGSTSRYTSGTLNALPVWSPDGTRIIYRSVRKGLAEFYQKSASGAGKDEPVLLEERKRAVITESTNLEPTDWSPDGRHLLYSTSSSNSELWLLPLSPEGGKPVRLIDSPGNLMHANFSPDGHLIAYTSNESGKWEVHVQSFPLSDRKWQVSTTGGYEPRWRGDGREIYYLAEDRKLMAVPVGAGPAFGIPKALFQTRVLAGVNPLRMSYVPSRDGRRFLVNMQSGEPVPNPITVVLNWTAGIKR